MLALAALLLVRVVGTSMEPTLLDGHFYYFTRSDTSTVIARGAVVLIQPLPSSRPKVKRVTAVPGDTLASLGLREPKRGIAAVGGVVPPGHYYIANDNPEREGWTSYERGLVIREWIKAVLCNKDN